MTLKARITAIDRFVKGLKEDNLYNDINAACVMAGWDSLAGALTPLKGAAPTNNGFIATDYDRGGIGITGDGSSYLDSGRAGDDDLQDDCHAAVFVQVAPTNNARYLGAIASAPTRRTVQIGTTGGNDFHALSNSSDLYAYGDGYKTGLLAASRASGSGYTGIRNGSTTPVTAASTARIADNVIVFGENANGVAASFTNATLAFYSLGSSLGSDPATGLAALDARVSTLMADLRAIEEVGFDRDAIAYIRAVEEADGAYLETDVKVAINNLVSGLKADGLWDAIGSSCLLCGPRTLAGALVPLRGDAPTAYGFVEGDFDRLGLQGDGTSYLDSNRANDADPQNDFHLSAYQAAPPTGTMTIAGATKSTATEVYTNIVLSGTAAYIRANNDTSALAAISGGQSVGLFAATRSSSSEYYAKTGSTSPSLVSTASAPPSSLNLFVFANNADGVAGFIYNGTLAFYSIGTDISAGLSKLDSHVSDYVTAIGAAI